MPKKAGFDAEKSPENPSDGSLVEAEVIQGSTWAKEAVARQISMHLDKSGAMEVSLGERDPGRGVHTSPISTGAEMALELSA